MDFKKVIFLIIEIVMKYLLIKFLNLAHDRAELELDSVAVDWVNWRLSRHCNVCKREFDSSATGVSTHCRRCGQLYCMRCIPRYMLMLL